MRYICTGGVRCAVGWCLDSLCGGSITGSLVWHLSLSSRSQYQWGAVLPVDFVCGRGALVVYVWYCPVVYRAHPGCLGASFCVICFSRLGCVRLVSYCDSLWWPMYEWCTGVCYSLVLCLCSLWCYFFFALSLPLSLFTICLHWVWSQLVIAYHSYGSLCYVLNL